MPIENYFTKGFGSMYSRYYELTIKNSRYISKNYKYKISGIRANIKFSLNRIHVVEKGRKKLSIINYSNKLSF